ncbi:MAG: alpha-glucan family phosphorylase [Planctomycetota bacterium]
MRPLRTFTVQPSLPPELAPLSEIAQNLRWSWNGDAQGLFRRLDPDLWENCYHNPVAMLGKADQKRLTALAQDQGFLAHLHRVYAELQEYCQKPGWWQQTYGETVEPQVAYFCAEFGITECLPIYSGGLGVLAGDHLKSASELDIPLVGVGLLYQQGYFRQRLNADGWQLELFPRNDFHNMPVQQVKMPNGQPLLIDIDFPGRVVKAAVWQTRVGRIDLYLLDTNVSENQPEDRHLTAQLYGGDQEMRIRQEIVLGIGGVRMLRGLGITPKAFHMNEGHSAFLALERVRLLMVDRGISFGDALEAVIASNIFTTHTPVPAGNDAFEPWLVEKYFHHYWPQLGLKFEQFIDLGRQEPANSDEPLNLTVMAIRLSAGRNGVSKLHGQVSRRLWANVWPGVPANEIPISHITNGVHTPTWISHDMAGLYDRYLGPGWHEKPADPNVWSGVQHIPDTELWRTHERRRERLVAFARGRLAAQLAKRGAGASELSAAEEVLDPEALTLGLARRFATYKRANLILSNIERLAKLLNDENRPMQIIFAGKAHPRDNPGKDLIRQIVHAAREERFRHRLVFLEDYDMNVARYLVQGVDVWLNTPLRPMEASGTSGMKVAANGGLNVSILDGWWAEGYEPDVGWAIGSGESYEDLEYQNAVESQALYDLLEKEIVPLFYARGRSDIPRGWVARMKAAMTKLAPVYNTNRMLRQYAEQMYFPAAQRWDRLTRDEMAAARQVGQWKRHVHEQFEHVRVEGVNDNMGTQGGAQVGRNLHVEASISLGGLHPDDLTVQLYYGPLDDDGQIRGAVAMDMQLIDHSDNGHARYATDMPCSQSGRAGYTVRVLPRSDGLIDGRDMALIRWA